MNKWQRAARGLQVQGYERRYAGPRANPPTNPSHSVGVFRRASGNYEKCRGEHCRDLYPIGSLDRYGLCSVCRAEQIDRDDREYDRRYPIPKEFGRPRREIAARAEMMLERAIQERYG